MAPFHKIWSLHGPSFVIHYTRGTMWYHKTSAELPNIPTFTDSLKKLTHTYLVLASSVAKMVPAATVNHRNVMDAGIAEMGRTKRLIESMDV